MREDAAAGSAYAGIMARLAPGEDPAHIVAWLVAEHGSLDSIDPVRFACAVKLAAERAGSAAAASGALQGA